MYVHVCFGARGQSCGLTRAPCNAVRSSAVANGFHATHMHASASVRLYICYKLSHAHDVHAKHAQVRSAERLCPESVPGGLNGRDNDGLGRYDLAFEGSHGPAD